MAITYHTGFFTKCYGSCYKSFAFRNTCMELGLRHIRTKPYTPKTNGKAERFIQTAHREWAYASLRDIRATQRSAAKLDPHVQLAQTSFRDKRETTDQPTQLGSEQPIEAPQLNPVADPFIPLDRYTDDCNPNDLTVLVYSSYSPICGVPSSSVFKKCRCQS